MAAAHDPFTGVEPDSTTLRLAFAALLLATLLAGLLCTFPELSFDIWWHLRTGRLIVDEGRIPTTDPFSYTAQGRPWVTHEWLAEVLFHGVHRLGGMSTLVLLKAAAGAIALLLSAAAGLAGGGRARLPAAALGVLLAGPLLQPRAFVRPHMLTALQLGAVLLCLRRASVDGRRGWIVALVPIFMLWANLHCGFVIGLGVVGLYWLGEAFEPGTAGHQAGWRRLRSRLPWLGAILAASLVNPHTVRAALYPFELVARREVREAIVELRSIFHPAYSGALFLKVLAATAIIAAALLWHERRRLRWSLVLPTVALALLAVRTLRGLSELAVVVPALIAAHGAWLGKTRAMARSVAAAVVALALVGSVAAIRWGVPMGADPPRRIGLGSDDANRPEAATRFLAEVAPPGRVFNILAFGGWFIHELWPQREVFIDGRLDVYPSGFLAAYTGIMATGEGWDEAVAGHRITFAVVDYVDHPERDVGLRAILRGDGDWVVVCFSDNALVYARRVPANAELIERFGCPFDPSLRTPAALAAWLADATPAEVARAAGAVERMLPFAPRAAMPRAILVEMLQRLAELALVDGRSADAVLRLEQVLAVEPASHLAHMRLGILRASAGDLAAARRHLETARSLRPDDPAVHANLRQLDSFEQRQQPVPPSDPGP
ncbi:MAG: tetratricopeptide repeat protein [Thermoanaerobaculales bacterium]|nr:tetratricopeptide repeat protein [Thermoanaerobaculales bacterium]